MNRPATTREAAALATRTRRELTTLCLNADTATPQGTLAFFQHAADLARTGTGAARQLIATTTPATPARQDRPAQPALFDQPPSKENPT
jgi:hypothetical protein